MRSLGRALIQYDWCPQEEGNLGTGAQGECHVTAQAGLRSDAAVRTVNGWWPPWKARKRRGKMYPFCWHLDFRCLVSRNAKQSNSVILSPLYFGYQNLVPISLDVVRVYHKLGGLIFPMCLKGAEKASSCKSPLPSLLTRIPIPVFHPRRLPLPPHSHPLPLHILQCSSGHSACHISCHHHSR